LVDAKAKSDSRGAIVLMAILGYTHKKDFIEPLFTMKEGVGTCFYGFYNKQYSKVVL